VVLVEVAIDVVWFHVAEPGPFAVAESPQDMFLDMVHPRASSSHDAR
jgi:hypothetical protein